MKNIILLWSLFHYFVIIGSSLKTKPSSIRPYNTPTRGFPSLSISKLIVLPEKKYSNNTYSNITTVRQQSMLVNLRILKWSLITVKAKVLSLNHVAEPESIIPIRSSSKSIRLHLMDRHGRL